MAFISSCCFLWHLQWSCPLPLPPSIGLFVENKIRSPFVVLFTELVLLDDELVGVVDI